jgi:hypothetical protein
VTNDRFNKLADVIYDRFADGPDRFDINDVRDEIRAELGSESVNGELLDEFANQLTRVADKRHTKRADSRQMDLLTGEVEALDSVWKIGGGQRVTARRANRTDVLMWLGIRGKNAAKVAAAFEKDRFTAAELLVYMPDDLITVEQAISERRKHQRRSGQQALDLGDAV